MANLIQAEGFGGGVRLSFLEKPGGHKTFIMYHAVEMCQEIVLNAPYNPVCTFIQELLVAFSPNDIVHCFRSEHCSAV